jgi:hypothetical protein
MPDRKGSGFCDESKKIERSPLIQILGLLVVRLSIFGDKPLLCGDEPQMTGDQWRWITVKQDQLAVGHIEIRSSENRDIWNQWLSCGEAILFLASRRMGRPDGFVKRRNILTKHSDDATKVGLDPGSLSRLLETSKLSFDLSSIFDGGRTLGFQKLEGRTHRESPLLPETQAAPS